MTQLTDSPNFVICAINTVLTPCRYARRQGWKLSIIVPGFPPQFSTLAAGPHASNESHLRIPTSHQSVALASRAPHAFALQLPEKLPSGHSITLRINSTIWLHFSSCVALHVSPRLTFFIFIFFFSLPEDGQLDAK